MIVYCFITVGMSCVACCGLSVVASLDHFNSQSLLLSTTVQALSRECRYFLCKDALLFVAIFHFACSMISSIRTKCRSFCSCWDIKWLQHIRVDLQVWRNIYNYSIMLERRNVAIDTKLSNPDPNPFIETRNERMVSTVLYCGITALHNILFTSP